MSETAGPKYKTCPRCGEGFGCSTDGPCWCAAEPYRMPLPGAGATPYTDCLCPACLRAAAAEHGLAPKPV